MGDRIFTNRRGEPCTMREMLDDLSDWSERFKCMYEKKLLMDLTFLVGPDEVQVQACKFMLAYRSRVFREMLARLEPNEFVQVPLPNEDPEAFQRFIKYLYLDELDCADDFDSLISYARLAVKYGIKDLQDRLYILHMKDIVTETNVCLLLEATFQFYRPDCMENWLAYIDAHCQEVIHTEAFRCLSYDNVLSIVQREALCVDELDLFNAVIGWASAECLRQNLDSTPENQRAVLTEILSHIRFSIMDLHEFANGPATVGVLTGEEVANVVMYARAPNNTEPLFPHRKRGDHNDN